MKIYHIYKKEISRRNSCTKMVKQSISIWGLLLGPLIFPFYKMWRNFFFFIILSFMGNYLVMLGFLSEDFAQIFSLLIHVFIASDFANQYEQHLLAGGYEFERGSQLIKMLA